MDTNSRHLFIDVWLKEKLTIQHLQNVMRVIDQNLTVVKKVEHKFEPYGETIVWILSESHFSIHTYPEHDYLSLDVYICNDDVDLDNIAQQVMGVLPFDKVHQKIFRRGDRKSPGIEESV